LTISLAVLIVLTNMVVLVITLAIFGTVVFLLARRGWRGQKRSSGEGRLIARSITSGQCDDEREDLNLYRRRSR